MIQYYRGICFWDKNRVGSIKLLLCLNRTIFKCLIFRHGNAKLNFFCIGYCNSILV